MTPRTSQGNGPAERSSRSEENDAVATPAISYSRTSLEKHVDCSSPSDSRAVACAVPDASDDRLARNDCPTLRTLPRNLEKQLSALTYALRRSPTESEPASLINYTRVRRRVGCYRLPFESIVERITGRVRAAPILRQKRRQSAYNGRKRRCPFNYCAAKSESALPGLNAVRRPRLPRSRAATSVFQSARLDVLSAHQFVRGKSVRSPRFERGASRSTVGCSTRLS